MKRIVSILAVLAVLLTSLVVFASCNGDDGKIVIAIPNDTTNEARALLLLEAQGIIELDDEAGITATIRDITSNPKNIEFKEMEAAQLPQALEDPKIDYAVINTNFAVQAELNPAEDALALEGSASAYVNILCVKEGNETAPKFQALAVALKSQQVADYIKNTYGGSVVSVVENPGDGYDAAIDYEALAGTKISVAASPTPHAEILAIAKTILAAKNITLEIREFTDYVQPNLVVENGDVDCNYFQHVPYLDDFNAQNNTHIVNILGVHVEPMGLYGAEGKTLAELK